MKRLAIILLVTLMGHAAHAEDIQRFVSNLTDFDPSLFVMSKQVEGTLRTVLHDACNEPGDDLIQFPQIDISNNPIVRIILVSPLVIPRNCDGRVTMSGASFQAIKNPDIVLDGSRLSGGGRTPGDLCILNVYSDDHYIVGFTFVGAKTGAGVCLFGRRNTVISNRFSKDGNGVIFPNRFDVVVSEAFSAQFPEMTGEANVVSDNRSELTGMHVFWIEGRDNRVSANILKLATNSGAIILGDNNTFSKNIVAGSGEHGVVLGGTNAILFGNKINANGGCPAAYEVVPSQPSGCNLPFGSGGAGIYATQSASGASIGSLSYDDRNIIQYNMGGGVVLENSSQISGIHVYRNTISKNYNAGIGIDLGDDGFSSNDLGDKDSGPNTLFNAVEHFQMFPLVGVGRYWGWGLAFGANAAEVSEVAKEDIDRKIIFGGGDHWLSDFTVTGETFEWMPGQPDVVTGTMLTTLVHDFVGNTSEYGLNILVLPDADLDGIPDVLETKSNPDEPDSDFDNLPDPVEDRNRNGICDKGETCAASADTDGDGLSDWAETRGDGRYDAGVDSSPWIPDSDGDGLLDGQEDTNGNGVWDGYLGETSPMLADSDGDGFPDGQDNCPMVPNPQQEPWFCI